MTVASTMRTDPKRETRPSVRSRASNRAQVIAKLKGDRCMHRSSVGDSQPPSSSLRLLLVAGALYLTAVVLKQPLMANVAEVFSDSPPPTSAAWPIAWLLVLLVPLSVLGIAMLSKDGTVRKSFRGRWRSTVAIAVTAALVSLTLNALTLWPFTWRWPATGTTDYARLLVSAGSVWAMVAWCVTGVVVIPLIEEAIFRVGLLRVLISLFRSEWLGVAGSSLVFSFLHLGTLSPLPDLPHAVNAAWLFAASWIIGHLTVRAGGSIQPGLAAHATRNALEITLLLVSIT